MVPKKIFFTKGVGKHKERLTSFELALRDAGIASQNLVRVSSIFPPQCKVIPRKEGLTYLNHGEVVFSVIAENSTREPHRLIVSSIGVAIPADRDAYGYLSEHHSFGETEEQAGEYAEELAAEMLATTLDVDFDPDTSWDEKKEIYRISNKIVRTSNITQSAVGDKRGMWTTTIAAAVLILESSKRRFDALRGQFRLSGVGLTAWFKTRLGGWSGQQWGMHANIPWGWCRCAWAPIRRRTLGWPWSAFAKPRGWARRSSACRNSSAPSTSASARSLRSLTLRRRSPARPQRGWPRWLARQRLRSSLRSSSAARRGFITIRQ